MWEVADLTIEAAAATPHPVPRRDARDAFIEVLSVDAPRRVDLPRPNRHISDGTNVVHASRGNFAASGGALATHDLSRGCNQGGAGAGNGNGNPRLSRCGPAGPEMNAFG
jgi:hypothetical protein